MTEFDVVWWSIGWRALLGSCFALLAFLMLAFAIVEYGLRRYRLIDPAQTIVLTAEILILICVIYTLGILALTAWLAWPFVVRRGPYTALQAIGAGLLLSLTFSVGAIPVVKYWQRQALGRQRKKEDAALARRLGGSE